SLENIMRDKTQNASVQNINEKYGNDPGKVRQFQMPEKIDGPHDLKLQNVSLQFLAIKKFKAQFVADNCNRFDNLITFLKEIFSTQLTTLFQDMTALRKAEVVNQLKTTTQKSLTKLKNLIDT
ncbi:hypothetical protein L9F63_024877, partial [Diploptera punctata]